MAIASGRVTTEIVDWEDFKKFGRELRVSSVPKTFINYGDPFSGVLPEVDFLERVVKGQ